MKIIQSHSFKRKVKKFGKQDKKVLDKQVIEIAKTPSIGTEKKVTFVACSFINSNWKALNTYFHIVLSEMILNW